MNLIGINGFKRAGKGETGNCVADLSDGVVYQVGFADKLKIMAALALGFEGSPRDLIAKMDDAKESWDIDLLDHGRAFARISGREYLQHFGNRAREQFGKNFWIDQVLPYATENGQDCLRQRYPEVDIVAITDLRYENEAERIKALGGVVWEVVRPGTASDGHASEQPLPRHLVDATIVNDDNLDVLRARVAMAMLETLR